jgi:hypothetical protein
MGGKVVQGVVWQSLQTLDPTRYCWPSWFQKNDFLPKSQCWKRLVVIVEEVEEDHDWKVVVVVELSWEQYCKKDKGCNIFNECNK